jgi:hypothetical protein
MYNAIETRFHGPTNTRPARVSARCDAGRIVLPWDYALGGDGNHKAAAVALATRLGWSADMIGGSLPGSGYAWVQRDTPSS